MGSQAIDEKGELDAFDWRTLHSQIPVCNIHYDRSIEIARRRRAGEVSVLETTYLPELEAGGVDCDVLSVGGDHRHFCGVDELFDGSLVMLDAMLADIADSPSFTLALKADDILEAKQQGRRALMFTVEGAKPIKEELWRLRTLYRLGVRSIILTWFAANAVGDGINEARGAGLSDFGKSVVAEMNRLGMLIDVSQCSPATFDDVMRLSEHPVIASHSNSASVYQHRRNLTDSQLEQLAKTGGIVGVHTFSSHLCAGEASVETLLDHVDHIIRTIGAEHVALGLNITAEPDGAVAMFREARIDHGSLYVKGIESMAQFGNITKGMHRRGHHDAAMEKILGGNFLRVLHRVTG